MSPDAVSYKMRAGQDTPWGVATAFCGGTPSAGGRWCCCAHSIDEFADANAMRAHRDLHPDECRIAWRCFSCERPHGWRS